MRTRIAAATLFVALSLIACVSRGVAAPCVVPPLSDQAVGNFKSNPKAIVAPDSDTRTIEALVRDLAATDPSLAAEIVRLAEATTPRFRTAIAAGLAQAAVACTNVDQNAALLIQQAVASFQDGDFQNSFAAVAGDLSTAATTAALSSAVSSVGSVEVINPNKGGGSTTNPGGGGGIAFFLIASGGATTGANNSTGTTPTTSTTAATPVSATR